MTLRRKPGRVATAGMALAVAAVSLAACSSSSSGSGGSDSKTITMWTFKQNEVPALEAVAAAWTKVSGVTVKVTAYTPDDTYTTKVRAAAKTGGLPDIVSAHSAGEDWQFAEGGILRDLTGDFDSSWSGELQPSVLHSVQLTQAAIKNSGTDPSTTLADLQAGHTYAVPYLAGTPGVVYVRRSTLAKAGLSAAPTTWQQWLSAMQATVKTDPNNGGLVTGLQVPETGYFWLYRPMAYAYLGAEKFLNRQGKNPTTGWDSPASVATLDLYNQLTPLWKPGVLALGIDQADEAFAQGKAAWDVGGTFTFGTLAANGVKAQDVVTFPIPAPTGGAVAKLSYQSGALISAGVSAKSSHVSDAVSFLKYLSSPAGAKIFAETASDLPATTLQTSDVTNPLVQQMLGLVSDQGSAFNPNDFSADPGGGAGTIGSDTATVLSGLPAKTTTPSAAAAKLAGIYKSAWAKQS